MGSESKTTDLLTGLYSKEYFDREVRKLIDENPDTEFSIIELDINRLTMINELYGLEEGDNLLKYIGCAIKDATRHLSQSVCTRIQADLFAFLCPFDMEQIEEIIEDIEGAIRRYSLMLNIDILLSFGIYDCRERELDVSIMRDRAKLALKTVKGNYIQHFAYYDDDMHEKIVREQEITQSMNRALANHEFCVYYQPKHCLDDERIIGAEALVRWNSPEKGMISPGEFIPLFEENGFIMKLDEYVWEETCRFIKHGMDAGLSMMPISVNISRVNLFNPELCQVLSALVEKYQVPYDMLELEFTESAYTEAPQLMLQTMSTLQEMGFKVEMDDFGSGYSSLNMLKDVPVDVLKIDLHFMAKTANTEKAAAIMTAIVRMAKWLGISSIVEGVETEEQISFLKRIGCTMVQGYYFAKPMCEEDFVKYIDKYSQLPRRTGDAQSDAAYIEIAPEEFWQQLEDKGADIASLYSAYALYEIYNDEQELMMASDGYYELFRTSRELRYSRAYATAEYMDEKSRQAVKQMFEYASNPSEFGECIFRRRCDDGKVCTVHAKAKLIGNAGKSNVFFVGMNDLTDLIDIQ